MSNEQLDKSLARTAELKEGTDAAVAKLRQFEARQRRQRRWAYAGIAVAAVLAGGVAWWIDNK